MVTIINAFGDNYIYLVEYSPGKCFVVDPGEARPVTKMLQERDLKLTRILLTHGHFDHIGGMAELKKHSGCEIIGPAEVSGADRVVHDGDMMDLEDMTIRSIATPGHTAQSVCYFAFGGPLTQPCLFSGDTLFVCGCGRVMGASMATMRESLNKLAALPQETLVYPGHDYTEENVRFALTVEPDSPALQDKRARIRQQTTAGRPTVPSTIAEEKQLNPFLRVDNQTEFTRRRKLKDVF